MPRTNVVRPDGSVASVEESQVAALEKLGYRREQAPEAEERAGRAATEAYYDTAGQKAIAFGEGLAGGVTLGLAELALDDQASREREEHLGGWKLGGEVIGAVGTALATGGSSALGSTARATPAGAALVFGERAAANIANPIARAAAANAIEGGISSGAITAAKVLTDNAPDTIESFAGEVGLGTLFGIGTGALVGGAVGGLGQVGKRASERIERRLGQAAGDDLVSSDLGRRAAQESSAHFDDAEKAIARERQLVDMELAAKNAQLEQARALVDGDGPTYTDLIDKALARQAAGEPIPNSYIARLGSEMAGEKPPTPHDWLWNDGPVPEDLGGIAREAGIPRPASPALDPNKTGAASGRARGTPQPDPAKSIVSDRVFLKDVNQVDLENVDKIAKDILGPSASGPRLAGIFEPPEGLVAEMDRVYPMGKGVKIGGDLRVVTPDGKPGVKIGDIVRRLYRADDGVPELSHDILWLNPKGQDDWAKGNIKLPDGIGGEISRRSLEQYTRAGIKRVAIPNANAVGKYYWQKLGYEVTEEGQEKLSRAFRKWAASDPSLSSSVDELGEEVDNLLAQPGGISALTYDGRNIGKEFLLSKETPSYSLRLNLDNSDPFYLKVRESLKAGEPGAIRKAGIAGKAAPEGQGVVGGSERLATLEKQYADAQSRLDALEAGGTSQAVADEIRASKRILNNLEEAIDDERFLLANRAKSAADPNSTRPLERVAPVDPNKTAPLQKVPVAAAPEPKGGTLGTSPGKIAARQAEAAASPPVPPPRGQPGPALKAIDDMEALEKEVMDLGLKSTRAMFRQKQLNEARKFLTDPAALQSLSAAGLREQIDILKNNVPEVYSGLQSIWGRFVDKDLLGVTPQDLASLSQTRSRLWQGLDDKDVPLLAAWTRLRAPGRSLSGEPTPISKSKPLDWKEESKTSRLLGRGFKYLGGRAVKGAIGGGFGAYALGWSAADAAWSGKLSGMLRGAKVHTLQRIDKSLARMASLKGTAKSGAFIGPIASQITAKDFEESSQQIHSIAGAGGREALYAATSQLRAIDPVLADGIVEDGMKRAAYLAKAIPKPPPQGLFKSTRWVPSDVDRAKLGGIVQAVLDPPFAIEQMAAGRLTPPVAAAFRETSPSLYARVAAALVDFANANPDAPVAVRRQVAVMLGAPADELQLYTAQLQAAFVAEPGDMGPAVTAKPPQNLPTQAQTLTER